MSTNSQVILLGLTVGKPAPGAEHNAKNTLSHAKMLTDWRQWCRLVQQLNLAPMMAAWAERQLAQPSDSEVIGPHCARLLSSLVTGISSHRCAP